MFKKRILAIILILLIALSFAGCKSDYGIVENEYQGKLSLDLYVPDGEALGEKNFPLQFNFSLVYHGDPVYFEKTEDNVRHIVGEDVILVGEGVEQLEGAEIWVEGWAYKKLYTSFYLMKEFFAESYINDYLIDSTSLNELNTATLKAGELFDKCYSLDFEFSYEGKIISDIKIEKIIFERIDLSFEISDLNIKVFDVPDDIEIVIENEEKLNPFQVDAYGIGGTPYYQFWHNTSENLLEHKVRLSGIALEDISNIEVIPLSDRFTLKKTVGRNKYYKSEKILETYILEYKKEYLEKYDSIGSTVILKVADKTGREYWYFDTIGQEKSGNHLLEELVHGMIK